MKATAEVYNLDMVQVHSDDAWLDVAPDGSHAVFTLPEIQGLTSTYFLVLRLEDGLGSHADTNFYWLSTRPDVLAWNLTSWFYTPIRAYADFTGLRDLPPATLDLSAWMEEQGDEHTVRVTVENPGANLAFFLHLKVLRGPSGGEVLPILWNDNDLSLLPGERREISATCRTADLHGADPVVEIHGWNVAPFSRKAVRP